MINSYGQIKVKGSIADENGESLRSVTVTLTGNNEKEGTTTDAEGNFTIALDKTGTYDLEIRFVGFQSYQQPLQIKENKTYDLGSITLLEDIYQLQEVEIVGRSKSDYTSEYSFSATKIGIVNKELPQALTAITKELIADRQAFQIAEAVKTVSSVSNSSFYNHFNIRGISQNESGQILNGMRTRQYYFLQPITSNIERVEVLKGPASVTFSSVDPGGSINMVTKKPLRENRKEVSMSVGSFSTLRGALDFTGPLNESKTLLYRVNAGIQKANSFRDLVQNNALLVSPSLSYIPNKNTAVNVEMIYSNSVGNLDRGQPIFGGLSEGETLSENTTTPINLNVGATNDYSKSEQWIMTTNLSQKITDNISFNGSYMKQTWLEDLEEHRAVGNAVDSAGNAVNDLIAMRFSKRLQFWDVDNVNAYFNFDFGMGSVNSKTLVGYDLHRWHRANGGGQNSARRYLLNSGVASSYNPENATDFQFTEINGVTMPKPNVSHYNLNNPNNSIKNTDDYLMSEFAIPPNLSVTNAVYLQEQLKFGKLSALLSLRYEWFKDITNYGLTGEQIFDNNTALIPRIGLSYEINKNLNVYATYLEGYQPQSNTVDLMPSTVNFFWSLESPARFDPLISDLKEIGGKASLLNNTVSMSLALYEINQKNILIPTEDPDVLAQRGADRSRGIEWDVAGYIQPNWQVNASYSFIDANIIDDDDETLIGEAKENTPAHNANLWTRYDFNRNTPLKGLGIGVGFKYESERIPWYTRGFVLPAYTIFDAAIYFQPVNSRMQLMAKLNNVFNQTHWLGAISFTRLFPGMPRNALLTVTYKF